MIRICDIQTIKKRIVIRARINSVVHQQYPILYKKDIIFFVILNVHVKFYNDTFTADVNVFSLQEVFAYARKMYYRYTLRYHVSVMFRSISTPTS